jgi:hypothetical protein
MADIGGYIIHGGDKRVVSRAFALATTAGDANEIVAAQAAGLRVCILALRLQAGAGAETVVPKSATTAIGASYVLAANQLVVLPYNEHGWYVTAAAEAFNLANTGGADVHVEALWCITV